MIIAESGALLRMIRVYLQDFNIKVSKKMNANFDTRDDYSKRVHYMTCRVEGQFVQECVQNRVFNGLTMQDSG